MSDSGRRARQFRAEASAPKYDKGIVNLSAIVRILNSFSNPIDIEGKHQTIPSRTSCNTAQVEVVGNLPKQLKANRKPACSITVLTGYLWQLEKLQKLPNIIMVRSKRSVCGHRPTLRQPDQNLLLSIRKYVWVITDSKCSLHRGKHNEYGHISHKI